MDQQQKQKGPKKKKNGYRLCEWFGIHMNVEFFSVSIGYFQESGFSVRYSSSK